MSRSAQEEAADVFRQGCPDVGVGAHRHAHHHHPFCGDSDAHCCRLGLHGLADGTAHEQGALWQTQLHARQVADDCLVVIDVVKQPFSVAVEVDVVREAPCPCRRCALVLVAHVFVDADDRLLERDREEDGRHGVALFHSLPHPAHEAVHRVEQSCRPAVADDEPTD